jgi:uncharacterized surface protein with fasciclin (FAS1) repeats
MAGVLQQLVLAGGLALGLCVSVSCGSDGSCGGGSAQASVQAKGDIVDVAVGAGTFNTLVAAVKAAGLAEALKGPGPFTVFAPTDEAFSKIDKAALGTLLKPENKGKLAALLKYHVVSGKLLAADVISAKALTTLEGQRIDISTHAGSAMVDGAKIVKTDIPASNGVIHVIDTVIMPSMDNIVATADKAGSFKTLIAAAKAAGLVDVLTGEGPLTVFAPTDEAFAKLPVGTLEMLLKPENKETLAAILKYHVVSGRVFSPDAVKLGQAATVQGETVKITAGPKGVQINGAKVVTADVDASNGVIHIIDAVLLPKDVAAKLKGGAGSH